MSSRAHKRRETVEISSEEPEERSALAGVLTAVPSAMRAALATVSTHRWAVLGAGVAVAGGVLMATGAVDFGKLTSSVTQYATSWTTPAEQGTAQSGTPSALETVAAVPAAPAHSRPARGEANLAAAVSQPSIAPCFTPDENCTAKVTAAIDGAKSEILVQAYSLTTASIVDALGRARTRGVKVRVILDKADERDRYSGGARLISQRILPYVDGAVAIAHSKVIVIDQATVITSSFNFSKSAQQANAEDMLVIEGHPDVAAAYRRNWEKRLAASRPYYGTMAPVL